MNFLIALLAFLITNPILSQEINISDKNGNKQGKWKKYFKNGNIKYEGQFQNNYPVGIFKFYYETSELKSEKEFFHQGKAAATRFYNKDGKIMSIGLYVDEVKDSTWVYFNSDSIVILSEDYKNGKLNGSTKTYYDNGKLYEHKIWNEGVQD